MLLKLLLNFNSQTKTTLGYVIFDVSNDRIPPALGQTKKPGWWFDQPTAGPSPTITPRNNG